MIDGLLCLSQRGWGGGGSEVASLGASEVQPKGGGGSMSESGGCRYDGEAAEGVKEWRWLEWGQPLEGTGRCSALLVVKRDTL